MAVQAEWAAAFAAADYERVAALYAPQVQFYGSTARLHTDAEGVLRYFLGLPPGYSEARFATPTILDLGANAFSASGGVVFVRASGASPGEFAYRMTQVFVRSDQGWRIAVHHASPCPAVEEDEVPGAGLD